MDEKAGNSASVAPMLVGLDALLRSRHGSAKKRVSEARFGVLTHAAAVDEAGRSTLWALREADLAAAAVFSPEHGLDGLAQAEEAVREEPSVFGAPLHGLYGATKESLTPTPESLSGLELLVIDLVDVGARYYTYVWTALLAARAARAAGVHTLILDRPNPLTGLASRLEGRSQNEELRSFVGLESIPMRHSLTYGELLLTLLAREGAELGREGAVSIVPVQGWERHRTAKAWDRPFVPPSPNMPTPDTALVYPGACLLEGTNLSEGRGTTTPFQTVGAPFLEPGDFAEAVGPLEGAITRPVRFRPTFDKHAGQVCGGLMLHVRNEEKFRPVEAYLRIIAAAKRLAPEKFEFLSRVYEFESEHPAFDLLAGTPEARRLLNEGADVGELLALLCPPDPAFAETVAAAETLVERARA